MVYVNGFDKVFPAFVQRKVRSSILINGPMVKELLKSSLDNYSLVDCNTFRHEATNYDSIVRTNMYKDLKAEYGEVIHTFLKYEITVVVANKLLELNKVNHLGVVTKLQAQITALRLELEVQKDSYESEIFQLHQEIDNLTEDVNRLADENVAQDKVIKQQSSDIAALVGAVQSQQVQIQELIVVVKTQQVQIESQSVQIQELKAEVQDLKDRIKAPLEYFMRDVKSCMEAKEGRTLVGHYLNEEVEPTVDKFETLNEVEVKEVMTTLDFSFEVLNNFLQQVSKFVDTTGVELHLMHIQETVQKYRKLVCSKDVVRL